MTFDGPGQQAALYQRGLCLRRDWEIVLAAVLDAILDRPDVDGNRVVSFGVGQAGYLLPGALAHEHRLAASVVSPGVVDVATAMIDALPPCVQPVLDNGTGPAFDRELHAELLFEPEVAVVEGFRAPVRAGQRAAITARFGARSLSHRRRRR